MTGPPQPFLYEEDPELPGWKRWSIVDPGRFNGIFGPVQVRIEDGVARVRMVPDRSHSNLRDHVHGGALLGFIDISLFAAARSFGVLSAGGASTLDLSTQFIAGAAIGQPIEARVELLRETGRLIFLRGLVVQDAATIASFNAALRKSSPRPAA